MSSLLSLSGKNTKIAENRLSVAKTHFGGNFDRKSALPSLNSAGDGCNPTRRANPAVRNISSLRSTESNAHRTRLLLAGVAARARA
jgi:hypothetical protein